MRRAKAHMNRLTISAKKTTSCHIQASDAYVAEPSDRVILNATLADLLSRFPNCGDVLFGEGPALFPDRQSLVDYGVMLTVKETLRSRKIRSDIFLRVLKDTICRSYHLKAA